MISKLIVTTSPDPFTRGLDYLYSVRSLALDPAIVYGVYDLEGRIPICTWIGEHVELVNIYLKSCLQSCLDCFHPWEQPLTQICAVPLDQSFGVDGFCNLQTDPITLLIDVGRVIPEDWLLLVAHECAHAHAGSPGHHPQFARSLTHLCLALDLAPPTQQPGMEDWLRFYPNCISTQDPLAFWRGDGTDWRSRLANSQNLRA